MGTVVFGVGYAVLFSVFGTASWLAGIVIGAVHTAVIGLVAMPMTPAVHPRMTREPAFAAPSTPPAVASNSPPQASSTPGGAA